MVREHCVFENVFFLYDRFFLIGLFLSCCFLGGCFCSAWPLCLLRVLLFLRHHDTKQHHHVQHPSRVQFVAQFERGQFGQSVCRTQQRRAFGDLHLQHCTCTWLLVVGWL